MKDKTKEKETPDYKGTLNLPKTDFPMKANLPQREPETLKRWEDIGLYEKILASRKDSPRCVLHDGPPYANENIHLGQALNKILKDFVVKTKTMAGFFSPYVPGWDCHGLPIELKAEGSLGKSKKELGILEIRKHCRQWADNYVSVQRNEFKRLGVFGDWENPYKTMDAKYQAAIVKEFSNFYLKGNVYRGNKPVYWCASCGTALAEAEVEYGDHSSPSIYVAFALKKFFKDDLVKKGASVLIWTTTPWTLPANLAIAFHPRFAYVAISAKKDGKPVVLVLCETLLDKVKEVCGLTDVKEIDRFVGKDAEGGACEHPFMGKESSLVLADYVTSEDGTGCVHTAPGHGLEDYQTGREYKLPPYSPLDDAGVFTEGPWAGTNVFDANEPICESLKQSGHLLARSELTHSYPHCWRCKKPVIFRATPQWFISMDKNDLRQKALEAIKKARWVPPWGEEEIRIMVAERPDWCISRQRAWGVPITVFHCDLCGEIYATEETFKRVAEVFAEEGADTWYIRPAEHFLPSDAKCGKCGERNFRKETDILDVWFDSGSSSIAVCEGHPEMQWPSDIYLEGRDQYRGWFNSSLMVAIMNRGKAPYNTVITHGFTVDERGRKMSKSLGNVIPPQEIVKKYGVEILRLWVAMTDYRHDMALSYEMLNRNAESYRKIRNTLRYILGNLYDFSPERDAASEFSGLNEWALFKLRRFEEEVFSAYEKYEFHRVYHALNNFCAVDMSAVYFDILKDCLYVSAPDSKERREAQTALWRIGVSLSKLMAPMLPFTADEVWLLLPGKEKRESSVHIARFERLGLEREADFEERWEKFFALRAEVNKALEIGRDQKRIGNSLEAKITLAWKKEIPEWAKNANDFLPSFFIVSQTEQITGDDAKHGDCHWRAEGVQGLTVWLSRAKGEKCVRCWQFHESLKKGVCARCAEILK